MLKKMLNFAAVLGVITWFSGPQSAAMDHKPGGGGPPTRSHSAICTAEIIYERSTERLEVKPMVDVIIKNSSRLIVSNGIPNHLVGKFPNCGNPHAIKAQNHKFRVTTQPEKNSKVTQLQSGMAFGVAINGIPFEPLAAEWWKGNRNSKWRYEALSGAVPLGPDESRAHVQPGGKYHYHGLPRGLIASKVDANRHSPLIGWAADGFPIYAVYGFKNKNDDTDGIIEMKSSYILRNGSRPGGFFSPAGRYDGAFVADYVFSKGLGELDECNGASLSTPEFPEGTYAYFLSNEWPFIPRCFRGDPDESFNLRGMGGPPKRGVKPAGCKKRKKQKCTS